MGWRRESWRHPHPGHELFGNADEEEYYNDKKHTTPDMYRIVVQHVERDMKHQMVHIHTFFIFCFFYFLWLCECEKSQICVSKKTQIQKKKQRKIKPKKHFFCKQQK